MNLEINDKVFERFPVLESERLVYRNYKKEDALDLLAIRSDEEVMRYMDSTPFRDMEDALKLIESCHDSFQNKEGINWIIVEKESNAVVGYFGYWRLMRSSCRAEIGYALKPVYWGKGYMKETLKRVLKFAFEDLRVHSIEANVNPENENSKQLLLKMGFQQEAYFRENYLFDGRFIDSVIYGLLETDF
ncbi:MAG: GNAT family N-acetyltransferase [Aureispira sp.]|nr:GNAT family N-acetyltransferase [Aureispira sp.]